MRLFIYNARQSPFLLLLSLFSLILYPSLALSMDRFGLRQAKKMRLQPRQEPEELAELAPGAPVVSFENFPRHLECANGCDDPILLYCPYEVDAPCPGNLSEKCLVADKSCFCSDSWALACSYSYCEWFDRFVVEDWFTDVCPETPKANFDGLPACAQACVRQGYSDRGCVSFTKSCICWEASFFGCHDKCTTEAETNQMLTWFRNECDISEDDYTTYDLKSYLNISQTANSSDDTKGPRNRGSGSAKPPGPGENGTSNRGLKWYEIYGLIMVLLTILSVSAVYIILWGSRAKNIKDERAKIRATQKLNEEKSASKAGSIKDLDEKKGSTEKAPAMRVSTEKK